MDKTRTLAIVGIDGSGKSTIIERLARQDAHALVSVTCPRYHETPDLPLASTSRALQNLSDLADLQGRVDGKIVAMFLQMTLFGPVESFVHRVLHPEWMAVERHALVDTLVFAPLYQAMANQRPTGHRFSELLDDMPDADSELIGRWHERENQRLGRELSIDELPAYILSTTSSTGPEALERFCELYQTTLPDAVIFFDLPVDMALARLDSRTNAPREQHESRHALEAMRHGYASLVETLSSGPGRCAHRIDLSSPPSPEELVEEVKCVLDSAYGGDEMPGPAAGELGRTLLL